MIAPCSATSTQIAKNLVLSGIGRVNLFDEQLVRQADIGNNFFLDQSSLGKPRVEQCEKLLRELNPFTFIDDSGSFLEPGCFDIDLEYGMSEVDAIMTVRILPETEDRTSFICWHDNVPAILIETCGLVARIRLQMRELGVIDTHPDSLADLRLDCPFPSMMQFVNSFEMSKMDRHDHGHIPAIVIVIHFLEIFKANHDGKLPQSSAERSEFKTMISAEKRDADEDNFDEAIGMAWKACQATQVPTAIQELFKDKHCDHIPKFATTFWVLVRALREFVNQNPTHQLPLSGVLPDMKSDTKNYVTLQSIYHQQAQEDLKSFKTVLGGVTAHLENQNDQRNQDHPCGMSDDDELFLPHISEETIESFVKNCAHLRLVRGRSTEEEWESPVDLIAKFSQECAPDNGDYTVTWYIAFRGLRLYRTRHNGAYPGIQKVKQEEDFEELSNITLEHLVQLGWDENLKMPVKLANALKEMVRSAGSELPQIASLVGGLVAQEVIKLTTQQYVPLNGTCIFDGYRSTTGVVNF